MDILSDKQAIPPTRKLGLNRETESLLKAAQNNAIRTNYIKERINKTRQTIKCMLCSNRGEMINHIISTCSKLAQKEYKTWHDLVGKVIHRGLRKKFDYSNKWYMRNPKSVLKNETRKGLWDFENQTDYLISARQPDVVIVKKKKKKKRRREN